MLNLSFRKRTEGKEEYQVLTISESSDAVESMEPEKQAD